MLKEILQPKSVEEVKKYLKDYKKAKILAGGTDIMVEFNKGKLDSEFLIDINKIEELKEIRETKENVILGSRVTFDMLKRNTIIKENFSSLVDCAVTMGSPQIRNAATIGGNIANAAPAADSIPCFMCFDGEIIIESIEGDRKVTIEEFYNNAEAGLKDNEIITKILLKKHNGYSGFSKLGKRKALAISRISTSVYLEVENNKIQNFKLCLGAVGRYAFSLHKLEEKLCGKEIKYLFNIETLSYIEKSVEESIKTRASMPFKKEAVKGLYKEAVRKALQRGGIDFE